MNNSRPGHTGNAAQTALAMMQERVNQSAALVPGRRMNHNTGSLVQDQQTIILIQEGEWHCLGLRFSRLRLRPLHLNLLARARAVRGFYPMAIDEDIPLFDQALDGAARYVWNFPPQPDIQTHSWKRLFDGENLRRGSRRFPGIRSHLPVGDSAGLAVRSFRNVIKNTSPTPVQIALSATLKAGKPSSPPLRCGR